MRVAVVVDVHGRLVGRSLNLQDGWGVVLLGVAKVDGGRVGGMNIVDGERWTEGVVVVDMGVLGWCPG